MNHKLQNIFRLFACIAIVGCSAQRSSSGDEIDVKVDSLLSLMTLEEKIGQMNQYNGFWDATGPAPTNGESAKKYEHLKKGLVGFYA